MRVTLSLLAGLLLFGCDPGLDLDGGVDAEVPDAGAVEVLPLCESTLPEGVAPLAHVASTLEGTISTDAARLLEPGSANPALERGELGYRGMGLDRYSRATGQGHTLRMGLGGAAPPATGRNSIAYFVHYSDFQLVDDESPTRLALVDTAAIGSGLRAQEAYLPRAISAMNRTLARIERPERPYDFGVITGDCADSGQENETRWVIDVMNGTPGLHTDSGDDDDPVPGPDNDPKDPFDPTAFPAPWLYVPGNHDVLVTGISLPDSRLSEAALGTAPVNGTRDYRQRWGRVTSRAVPADPMRRLLSRGDIVDMLLTDMSGPGPVGHGYPSMPDLSNGANYTYDAIPGLLRIITFDTNDDTGGANGLVHRATVDEFLIPALVQAEMDGVLAIVASHHAAASIDVFRSQLSSEVVPDAVPPGELETIIAAHPNAIAWVVGHSHDNRIRAVRGPDVDRPGYWEIMTSAIADYPGQARVIEIVSNGDGTLSIYGTLVDFDEDSCAERRYRQLLVMEYTSGWADRVSTAAGDMNVELVRTIPMTAVAAVTAAAGMAADDRIESLTTLAGE